MKRIAGLLCVGLLGCLERLDLGSDRRPVSDAASLDEGGAAAASCDAGKVNCSGDCADPQSSLLHCGQCDIVCTFGREICLFGVCSPCVNGTNCGDACVHLSTDPMHCGRCDLACQAGMTCANGLCK